MARNMITGIETQKMQEYTQEQIDRAEHMGIAIPADVKEQIFEYANLVGEEEKVRTLVRNLADAVNRSDEDRVEELLDDAQMDIQDLPDPTIGKLELRDYGYTAEDMVPLRKEAALDYHRMGRMLLPCWHLRQSRLHRIYTHTCVNHLFHLPAIHCLRKYPTPCHLSVHSAALHHNL